jgi:hypothetical protein
MKINDIILENQQLDELTAGQVGSAIGKGVGAVARGAGAVAGGVAGAGKAFMKGFRGGKATVAGDTPTTKTKPGAAQPKQTQAPGAQPKQTQPVNMKTIQSAISQLPQNQIASLRAIAAKRAGVRQ